MKKAIMACLLAVMMVGMSVSVFAGVQYSNKWDGSHDRDWVGTYDDGDGCIVLGNNPWSIHNRHNRGNNPHKLLAYWWLWFDAECGLNNPLD